MQEYENSFLYDLIDKKETCNKSASVKRHINHSTHSVYRVLEIVIKH